MDGWKGQKKRELLNRRERGEKFFRSLQIYAGITLEEKNLLWIPLELDHKLG